MRFDSLEKDDGNEPEYLASEVIKVVSLDELPKLSGSVPLIPKDMNGAHRSRASNSNHPHHRFRSLCSALALAAIAVETCLSMTVTFGMHINGRSPDIDVSRTKNELSLVMFPPKDIGIVPATAPH